MSVFSELSCFVLWETSVLVLQCILTWRSLGRLFLTACSSKRSRQALSPILPEQEQRVVTSCGDFAMWRNWHGDEITLVLLSDLKECEPTDLIYMQTLADALIHTTL